MTITISIELLAIFIPILFGVAFLFFLYIIKRIRIWKYKPENDKGRLAEEGRLRERIAPAIPTATQPERRTKFSIPTSPRDSWG